MKNVSWKKVRQSNACLFHNEILIINIDFNQKYSSWPYNFIKIDITFIYFNAMKLTQVIKGLQNLFNELKRNS